MANAIKDDEISILKEILKWIKFAGMKEVKTVLENELQSEQEKIAYQNSDGTKGTRDLAKLVGVGSNKTIDLMWGKWFKMGLGESIPVKGGERFKRSFDLLDFGIKVPEITKEKPNSKPEEQNKTE